MKTIVRTVVSLLLALAGFIGTAHAQIPVTDIASIEARQMEHLQSISKWVEQYKQMERQYKQLVDEYQAMTGSYGRGQIGLNEAVQAAGVVPGSWQDVVARQASGAYGSRQKFYEDLIKTMPSEVFQAPDSQRARYYKMSTDSVRAALAGGEALFDEVQTHLQNLELLSHHVDSTANVKDAADLQNRISTENGMLNTAMGKISAMNMNLQANLLNRQNQATAASERYFQWDDSTEEP